MMEKMRNAKKKKGFTLIELIVVIAILGILAAIIIPRFGGFTDKARSSEMLVNAKQVATAFDLLITEKGVTEVQTMITAGTATAEIKKLAGDDIQTSEISALGITNGRGTFTYKKTLNSKEFTATRDGNGKITVTWPS